MPDEKYLKRLTIGQSLITGAIAGTFEVTVNHPLWVIKKRLHYGQTSAWQVKGLYRGLASNLVTMAPLMTLRISLGTTFQNIFYSNANTLTNNQLFVSALAGGIIPSFIGSPLELVRIKQQKNHGDLASVFNHHIRLYGATSLLSGLPAAMTRDALLNIGFFALTPIIKEKIKPYIENESVSTMISGPIAGIIAGFTSQPFDAIKSYQQIALEKEKISTRQTIKEIIKTNGYSGFFKGATPRITRVISSVAIIYNINNSLTNYFYPDNTTYSGPKK